MCQKRPDVYKRQIVYRSEEPLAAVITGAEPVKNWTQYQGNVWTARIPNGIFGCYNPYTTVIAGDWYRAPEPVHTGEVDVYKRQDNHWHGRPGKYRLLSYNPLFPSGLQESCL